MVGGDICLGLSRSTDPSSLTTYGMNTYEHRDKTEDKSKTNIWIGSTCAHCIEEPGPVCFENQVFPGCISIKQKSKWRWKQIQAQSRSKYSCRSKRTYLGALGTSLRLIWGRLSLLRAAACPCYWSSRTRQDFKSISSTGVRSIFLVQQAFLIWCEMYSQHKCTCTDVLSVVAQ